MVKDFYAKSVEYEWNRLTKDAYHSLEFSTTLFFLKKYLPKRGLILDAGGGPGRYTIELAKNGYDIILYDLVKENLDFATKRIKKEKVESKVKDIVQGDIKDLSKFKENTFDAVLCLGGPLSHIKGEKQRSRAVSELIRVAKPRAPIFVSVFGKFGKLMRGPRYWPEKIRDSRFFFNLVNRGENTSWKEKYTAHYFTPEEIKGLFEKNNFEILTLAGLEGLGSCYTKEINKLSKDEKAWENWLKAHYKLLTHPVVAGMSVHMLLVGRKISRNTNFLI